MAKPVTWFKGSSGLNNRIDPARLSFNPETGIQELATAYNVQHDYTGRIYRRKGWVKTDVDIPCHSLFGSGDTCLFVESDALCVLGTDFTFSRIRQVTENARMSYVALGNKIYYANGYETGFVMGGISYEWSRPATVYGPETKRVYVDPPVGSILAYYNGRMFVAQGNTCWYSEPFGVNLFDLARSFIYFSSQIKMLKPVREGIFIGTSENVQFVGGGEPKEFSPRVVSVYPAVPGTAVYIDGSRIGDGGVKGLAVLWTSTDGIYVGTENGEVMNLTWKRLVYPRSARGAGLCIDSNYIVSLDP